MISRHHARSPLTSWLLLTLAGVAVLPAACRIETSSDKDEETTGEAGKPSGAEGGASEGGGGAGAGQAADGGAREEGGAGGAAGDAVSGGAGGEPIITVEVPDAIVDGNVHVSCTVSCGDDASCTESSVFISACADDELGTCYDITPIDDPSGKGNTYLVTIDDKGKSDVQERTECTATTEALPVDLLFAIDTTSSMGSAINGVLSSIDAFVSDLAKQGVKMRIGGIAFGDTAPLVGCTGNDAPFVPFTSKFGPATKTDTSSFNYWLSNVSASHCGDSGGDGPEGGVDALEFALGHDTSPDDAFSPDVFDWSPDAVHEIIVITDTSQHQVGDGTTSAHYSLEQLTEDLRGFGVVHVVGPNSGCYNTPAAGCACNVTANSCDEGCACDMRCLTPDCSADKTVNVCDDVEQTCDRDCAGFPDGVGCDLTVNRCDPAEAGSTEACASDVDCAGGAAVCQTVVRRCEPTSVAPRADIGQLTISTRGAFTALPATGTVDLTKLPLGGVIASTEKCGVKLPENTAAVRCIYQDDAGHAGEVVVDVKR